MMPAPHRSMKRPAQVDVTKHLEAPSLTPARLVEHLQINAGDRAGVIDQNTRITRGIKQRPDASAR